jgi:hypothetical protein
VANFRQGDEVYLVPNLPTAPSVAYKLPRVTVKSASAARATVELPDGTEITTDTRNLALKRPEEKTTKNMVIRPKLPDGFKEQSLW